MTLFICDWQVPAPFDLEAITKAKASDPSALHVVLLQELERYNALLATMRRSCSELQKGLKGVVVMSADLDDIATALFANKVGTHAGSSAPQPLCGTCAGAVSLDTTGRPLAASLLQAHLYSCLAPQQVPGALRRPRGLPWGF